MGASSKDDSHAQTFNLSQPAKDCSAEDAGLEEKMIGCPLLRTLDRIRGQREGPPCKATRRR